MIQKLDGLSEIYGIATQKNNAMCADLLIISP